jgi:shikimate dehydrogenase
MSDFKDTKVGLSPETLFIFSTSGSASSIAKHNTALQSLDVDLAYFTFGRQISAKQYMDLLRSPISRGGAVTGKGLKSSVIEFLDEIDKLAEDTNCVNTVVNNEGKLYGYNTDSFGFETALNNHIKSSGLVVNKTIIYGNGGVSGSAAHVLKKMGIQTTMTGRNSEKVALKMDELKLDTFEGPYDLVVNATPVSKDQITNITGLVEILENCKVVFDHNIPEKDGRTNYLKDYCKAHDIYFIPGGDMYNAQMIKQWQLFLDVCKTRSGQQLTLTDDDIRQHWPL